MTVRVFKCLKGHMTRSDTEVQGWPCPECREPTTYDWRKRRPVKRPVTPQVPPPLPSAAYVKGRAP